MNAETINREYTGSSERKWKDTIGQAAGRAVSETLDRRLPTTSVEKASMDRVHLFNQRWKKEGLELRPAIAGYIHVTSALTDIAGKAFNVVFRTDKFGLENRALAWLASAPGPLDKIHWGFMNLPIQKQLITRPIAQPK